MRSLKKITCAFYTLGCKVNQYETELMLQDLEQRGLELVDFSDKADIYIINTCTVTSLSDHKSRQVIRRALRQNPAAFVAVTGCYAESAPAEIHSIPGVKLVLGNKDKIRLPEVTLEKAKIISFKSPRPVIPRQKFHTRALIKIQDGCDQFCSFCKIPYVRGKPSSRPEEEIICEVARLVKGGVKEIILTGIHLGKYGIDQGGQTDLFSLLSRLAKMEGLARIRLSSLEVKEITPDLISLIASSPKFCRHLHIPLQSGNDEILKAMNRNYTKGEYLGVVRDIRKSIPEVALTTDIMVGFPGESEGKFEETKRLVLEVSFSKLHVFKFSPREGTIAAFLKPAVAEGVKKHRSETMLELGRNLREAFLEKYIGRVVKVLAEEKCKGQCPSPKSQRNGGGERKTLLTGLTDNYARVYFEGPREVKGQIVKVQVLELRDGRLWGKLV